jgi:DNA recombination protein RmuC
LENRGDTVTAQWAMLGIFVLILIGQVVCVFVLRTQLRTDAARSAHAWREALEGHREQLLAAMHRQAQQSFLHTSDAVDRLDARFVAMQARTDRQLEAMRGVVEEKLQATLERRLNESFALVSERLALVHEGLGEMHQLASGVGDLKRVLSNVKTRGILGEMQLHTIIEQVFAPAQYERQARIRAHRNHRCDVAVRLPHGTDGCVLLPIDAKFPLEDYEKMQEAMHNGQADRFAQAAQQLEARMRQEAKSIRDQYIDPPYTTEFAILFLPLEGLYAEVLRRPGLWDTLAREFHVIVTGPTTLLALLSSVHIGMRSVAVAQRTHAMWHVLRSVKAEFDQFSHLLVKAQKKLHEAATTLDGAQTRTRDILRSLDGVEAERIDEGTSVRDGN